MYAVTHLLVVKLGDLLDREIATGSLGGRLERFFHGLPATTTMRRPTEQEGETFGFT